MSDDATPRWTRYFRGAVWNVYNVAALAGTAVAAIGTHSVWVAVAAVGAEAVWMLAAPANPRFRRAVDARFARSDRLEHQRRMNEQSALLPSESRQKAQQLMQHLAEVKAECQRNPKLQGDFMKAQIERLDDLVAEYIHLAITAYKCEAYLNRADTKQLGRERDTWRHNGETAVDEAARSLAAQNLSILEKRLTLVEELGKFVTRARGQLSLIQNTVALLRDQVMTMATPESLTLQLDELVISVESIREATRQIETTVGVPPSHEEAAESERPRPTDRVRS